MTATPKPVQPEEVIPGGIKTTDHWHRGTNDNTCSRCRKDVPEEDVPLMLWANDGEDMLIYCGECAGWDRADEDEEA